MSASIGIIGGADGPTAIFITGTHRLLWTVLALGLMAFFYAVYLGKMFAQRRQGIRTDQMARGKKPPRLFYTELLLKISTYAIVPVELASILFCPEILPLPGFVLGLLGDLCFAAAVFTMRSSWRAGIPEEDKTDLITSGIFRWSRNPAFLGFDLLYLGVLLMYFNVVLLLFTLFAMTMLHLQILQEEQFLTAAFGAPYTDYRRHTLRYFGRR